MVRFGFFFSFIWVLVHSECYSVIGKHLNKRSLLDISIIEIHFLSKQNNALVLLRSSSDCLLEQWNCFFDKRIYI